MEIYFLVYNFLPGITFTSGLLDFGGLSPSLRDPCGPNNISLISHLAPCGVGGPSVYVLFSLVE